jgi:hypothetical protein
MDAWMDWVYCIVLVIVYGKDNEERGGLQCSFFWQKA